MLTGGVTAVAAPGNESATPTNWTIAPRTGAGTLSDVSCFGPNRCVAVGTVGDVDDATPLIERWNGSTRTVEASADLGPKSFLQSVTCVSAVACVAVGTNFSTNPYPVVERWDGYRWQTQPVPGVSKFAELSGVSCYAAGDCMAVGTATYGSSWGFGLHWSRGRWTSTTRPDASDNFSALRSVSCPSRNLCIAVGNATPPGSAVRTRAERWDGHRWTVVATPTRDGKHDEYLTSVSCATPTSCVAVGESVPIGMGNTRPLIERWDGARWSVDPVPAIHLPGFDERLTGVACVSPLSCVAVGSAESGGVVSGAWIMSWDGTRWSLDANRPGAYGPEHFSYLNAISCTFEHCAAVGTFRDAGPHPLGVSGTVPRRVVTVSWTAAESTRLHQLAAYPHRTPAGVQKLAVYALAYVTGGRVSPARPVALPPAGNAVTYATVWDPSEFTPLDALRAHYDVDSAGATRLAVYFLSYAFALHGR